MILIFGGAYQGKLEYATNRFGLSENDIFFCTDGNSTTPTGKKIIHEVDKWILSLIRENKNIPEEITHFLNNNPSAIVICTDISCGIVPIDPVMRRWREETGRLLGQLAQHSKEVIRLYCGIPTTLKGA